MKLNQGELFSKIPTGIGKAVTWLVVLGVSLFLFAILTSSSEASVPEYNTGVILVGDTQSYQTKHILYHDTVCKSQNNHFICAGINDDIDIVAIENTNNSPEISGITSRLSSNTVYVITSQSRLLTGSTILPELQFYLLFKRFLIYL